MLAVLATLAAGTMSAASKPNVVTTTEDLASLSREVGGDRIVVDSIAKGYQDPHFVEPKPSFLLKLQKADLLVAVGLQLELGWLPPLVTQSRNSKIQGGAPGYFDVSRTCRILEIPSGQITRAMGDVHPLGNPHYWLDPDNGRRIAKALRTVPGAGGDSFTSARIADFDRRLAAAEGLGGRWLPMWPERVTTIVLANFCDLSDWWWWTTWSPSPESLRHPATPST
jgi:zinc/manganese transport system substrate-binding protein